MKTAFALLAFLALVAAVAASGMLFQPGDWYAELAKPAWTPPGWVFGPVWSVIYLTIAVAGWLVWPREGLAGAPWAFAAYGTQLLFNGLWSALFFGLQRPGLALVDLGLLLLALLATIFLFARVHRLAALLLVPYLLWGAFAGALNFAIWRMNP